MAKIDLSNLRDSVDFTNVKDGTKVFDIIKGFSGVVSRADDAEYPVTVTFILDNSVETFTETGKAYSSDAKASLYYGTGYDDLHDAPQFCWDDIPKETPVIVSLHRDFSSPLSGLFIGTYKNNFVAWTKRDGVRAYPYGKLAE